MTAIPEDVAVLVRLAEHVYAATGHPATVLYVPAPLVERMTAAALVAGLHLRIEASRPLS